MNMAKMCPMDGCNEKKGLCIHDKMMIVMGVMAIGLATAHWAFGLI